MTKRYYDDPLAAAGMAKHFGMEFYAEPRPPCYPEGDQVVWDGDLGALSTRNTVHPYEGRCYIRPNSRHILEPQEGDVGLGVDGLVYRYIVSIGLWVTEGEFQGMPIEQKEGVAIIHRNGMPFHWPKEEEHAA